MKQDHAEKLLKMGHNVLLTGAAGSGKTFLLNQYIRYLRNSNIHIGITASTGIAATHLNGRTIHSWAKIGIEEKMTKSQLKKLFKDKQFFNKIQNTSTLIIDEISMLSASRLDLVDDICKAIRQDMRPFGGIQIVLCGDFFQLSPVARGEEDSRFITESAIWKKMNAKVCYLSEQYRQKDKEFVDILNNIRDDKVTVKTYNTLKKRLNKSIEADIKPTSLYALNHEADNRNIKEINKLEGDEFVFKMTSHGLAKIVKNLKKDCLAHEAISLKKGAVVIFIKNNFIKKYVNGTLGKVIDFDKDDGYPIVRTMSGNTITATPEKWTLEDGDNILATINQIPLRLAWGITIHKSQGMSLDCAEIDLSRAFNYGMGYVALSRVRSLNGIKLLGINKSALKINKNAIKLNKRLVAKSNKDLIALNKLDDKTIIRRQKKFIKTNQSNRIGLFVK